MFVAVEHHSDAGVTHNRLQALRRPAYVLARTITAGAARTFPGPAGVALFIRQLAEQCLLNNRPMEWVTPSGFPVSNLYLKSNIERVYLLSKFKEGGYRKSAFRVGNGYANQMDRDDMLKAAAPNYVHSLDSAHLAYTVNMCVALRGITDLVVVHDSYGCHAPHATELQNQIRIELAMMYMRDPLRILRDRNGTLPLPPYGNLDLTDVMNSEFSWH